MMFRANTVSDFVQVVMKEKARNRKSGVQNEQVTHNIPHSTTRLISAALSIQDEDLAQSQLSSQYLQLPRKSPEVSQSEAFFLL